MIDLLAESRDHFLKVKFTCIWVQDGSLRHAGLFSEIQPGKFLPDSLKQHSVVLCTVFVEIFFQPIYLNIQSNHCVMMAIHWHFVVSVKLLEFWFLRSRLMLPHNHKTILTRAIFSCRRIEREIERERSQETVGNYASNPDYERQVSKAAAYFWAFKSCCLRAPKKFGGWVALLPQKMQFVVGAISCPYLTDGGQICDVWYQ